MNSRRTAIAPATVRCGIYTRKSTEEGLRQEFNSLDAQREAAEAFIRSEIGEGWTCLSDRYDEGGFTGANTDRPALTRLLADIEAGEIDRVIVYKVDRLSRSLLDFSRLMEVFEKRRVSFVSVTQHFNSATSMSRLTLNILLSFAQFEREIISERTRDKMSASRRKGKYVGGQPVLGYDVDRLAKRLVVNEDEAVRVRGIFASYLEQQALLPVVQELDRRGWVGKRCLTRDGLERAGKAFMKTSVHKILTNVSYIGKVRYKDEIYNGEQAAIIDLDIWQKVQAALARNGRTGGGEARNQFGAILKGLLHCVPCGCSMIATHTSRKGNKRYRYYVCTGAQKRGWHTCPSKSIPAGEIERHVINQVRGLGSDPVLVRETLAQARAKAAEERAGLEAEQDGLQREAQRWNDEIRGLLTEVGRGNSPIALQRLAELQERIRGLEQRLPEINAQLSALEAGQVTEDEVAAALGTFDPIWNALNPREQARIVQLLVERIDYDGGAGTISITFHPSGFKTLVAEQSNLKEKRA